MGRASSSKKVARVAGTGGGRTNRAATPWSYFGILALIVVVGVALTWTSRSRYISQQNKANSSASSAPPAVGTTWYEAVGFYACGQWLTTPVTHSALGINTNAKGVMVISPKKKSVAGKHATLGKYAKLNGLTLNAANLQLPGGKHYQNGNGCGSDNAKLYVKEWPYAGSTTGTLSKSDPRKVTFTNDGLMTIAYVAAAKSGSIPPPPDAVQTAMKNLVTPTTTTTVPSSTTTTKSGTSTTTTKTSTTTAKTGSKSTTTIKSSGKKSTSSTTAKK